MVFNLQFSFEITGKRGVDGQEKLRVTTEAPAAAEMPRAQSLFFFILITKRCHSYEESKKKKISDERFKTLIGLL